MHGKVVGVFAVFALIHFLIEEQYLWRMFSKKTSDKEKKKLKKNFPFVAFITL
jgi:hypothetical protein